MYSKVLSKLPRNIASSAYIAFVYSALDIYRFDSTIKQQEIIKGSKLDKNIQGILKELNITKTPRVTIPGKSEGILAASVAIPFLNKDKIIISTNEIAQIYNKSDKKISKRNLAKGILAHENVHNSEYHSFFIRFGSSVACMFSYDIAKAVPIKLLQHPIISLAIFASTYILLHRHCEYRADKIAAQHNPLIRESLITSFDIIAKEHESERGFFSHHPKTASRIERLKKLRAEDSEHSNIKNNP